MPFAADQILLGSGLLTITGNTLYLDGSVIGNSGIITGIYPTPFETEITQTSSGIIIGLPNTVNFAYLNIANFGAANLFGATDFGSLPDGNVNFSDDSFSIYDPIYSLEPLTWASSSSLKLLNPKTPTSYIEVYQSRITGFDIHGGNLYDIGLFRTSSSSVVAQADGFFLNDTAKAAAEFNWNDQGEYKLQNVFHGYTNIIDVRNSLITGYQINASGYLRLSGQNVITTAQTGQFYSSSNPNQYATSGNLLSTGSSLQTQVNALNSWTGISTGLYYPLTGNPSGFVTGSVVRPSETGVFATATNLASTGQTLSNWTGSSTGLYYPLTGNPSGFVINGVNLGLGIGVFSGKAGSIGNFYSLTGASGSRASFSGAQILIDSSSDIGLVNGYNMGFDKLNRNITGTTNVLSGISDLSFPVVSGGYYGFEALLNYYTSHPTCGLSLAVDGPTGAGSTGAWMSSIMTGSGQGTIMNVMARNCFPTGNRIHTTLNVNTSGVGGAPLMAKLEGYWAPNTGGDVTIQFAPEVNGNTGVILKGSWLRFF